MLAGLLHPTAGTVEVEGHTPFERKTAFLEKITLVMGQKSQLIWDLPPAETYALNRAVFDVPPAQFDKTLAELTELLELAPLLDKPTRQLSLGERMKCELAAALLHRPTTLFLDEPTIGLDVAMQVAIRDFVRSYNQRHEATVLLTSHYMVRDGQRITLRVAEREVAGVIGRLLGELKAADLAIEDPPLEDVLRAMFGEHRKPAGEP